MQKYSMLSLGFTTSRINGIEILQSYLWRDRFICELYMVPICHVGAGTVGLSEVASFL